MSSTKSFFPSLGSFKTLILYSLMRRSILARYSSLIDKKKAYSLIIYVMSIEVLNYVLPQSYKSLCNMLHFTTNVLGKNFSSI